jgi:MinD-like ATPase involved in chromosome partitioning or flagellar assembly
VKILIVDKTAESQADLARIVNTLSSTDIEALDLTVNLCPPNQMMERLNGVDLLFLGPNLDNAAATARKARSVNGAIQAILFVRESEYEGSAFRFARAAGVRKVFSRSCSQLDLLQELLAIQSELLEAGRVMQGKLVVVTQAKGGVGATSFCAALSELCNEHGRKTLLWDCDVESRTLSRAMLSDGFQGRVLNDIIEDKRALTRHSFRDAMATIGENVSLISPPTSTAAGNDLLYHPDFVDLAQRVVDLAKISFHNIIVDAGRRLGISTGALMRLADEVVVIADDSMLGMMALDSYLEVLMPVIGEPEKIKIVFSGTALPNSEVQNIVDEKRRLPQSAWQLPVIPYDAAGMKWPGSGKTLFGLGQAATRSAIQKIGDVLQVIPESSQSGTSRGFQKRISLSRRESAPRSGMQGLMQRVMSFSISQN